MDTQEYRRGAVMEYNRNNNDDIKQIHFHSASALGEKNAFFDDLNMMYFPHCFSVYDVDFIKNVIYDFKDEIKESELYRTLEEKRVHTTSFISDAGTSP